MTAKKPKQTLYRYQRKWIADASPRRTWTKGRGIGASHAIAFEAALRAAGLLRKEPPADVLLLSKSQRNSRELLRYVSKHAASLAAQGACEVKAQTLDAITFGTGARVLSMPGSTEPAAVRGFRGHAYCDEAAYSVSEAMWSAIEGVTTPTPQHPNGFTVALVGTAGPAAGVFFEAATEGYGVWSHHVTTYVDAFDAGFPCDPEEKRREVGARVFSAEYMGIFGSQEGALLSPELLDRAMCEDDEIPHAARHLLALDVGRAVGGDPSALVRARQRDGTVWVQGVTQRHGMPFAAQRDWLAAELAHAPSTYLIADETGLGKPVVEELRRVHGGKVRGLVLNRGLLLELAEKLRLALEAGRFRITRTAMRALQPQLLSLGVVATPDGTGLALRVPRASAGHQDAAVACLLLQRLAVLPTEDKPLPRVPSVTGLQEAFPYGPATKQERMYHLTRDGAHRIYIESEKPEHREGCGSRMGDIRRFF